MDNQELRKFIGHYNLTVSEAMQQINKNACGILFLADEADKLLGCLTDGDIRRFLLGGGKMDASAMEASNKKPLVAQSAEEASRLYHQRYFFLIPIINSEGIIIDFYGDVYDRQRRKKGSLNIPVVINAGGRGTRLDPFTKVLPKPLIPVGELPIIEHIIQEYETYNCEAFHIIVNYKKELIKAYFSDNENHYNITWYDEETPLGTGGGLGFLRNKLDKTFFFANCDALLTADYESMLKFHREKNNVITMICAYKNINIPYGVVEMGVNGTIEKMKEKPLISFLTNTGMYIVEPEVIDDIGINEVIDFPNIVEREKQKGKKVAVFPVSEKDWMDMGQLPELEKMRMRLYGE